jgi:hypothetical protein
MSNELGYTFFGVNNYGDFSPSNGTPGSTVAITANSIRSDGVAYINLPVGVWLLNGTVEVSTVTRSSFATFTGISSIRNAFQKTSRTSIGTTRGFFLSTSIIVTVIETPPYPRPYYLLFQCGIALNAGTNPQMGPPVFYATRIA